MAARLHIPEVPDFTWGTFLELTLPTRVRWDVDFRGRTGRPKQIARRIAELAPESVELRIESGRAASELSHVVTELQKGRPAITAMIRLSAETVAAVRWGYPVRLVWEIESPAHVRGLLPHDAGAIAFTPDEETVDLLPDVLEEFAEGPAKELILPNVNAIRAVAVKGYVPVPRPERFRDAAGKAAHVRALLSGKRLVIHDYFLWKALHDVFPDEAGEGVAFSGCQAGSGLAHVDWDGNVYPCDSIPVRLGNLFETSFARIWGSPARRNLMKVVGAVPPGCESCYAYSQCFGGCRGLAYLTTGTLGAPNPCCERTATAASPKGGAPRS
jgi:GeoRSP system SPASM domain protein